MKIHNFLELELKGEVIHEGEGYCQHSVVFEDREIDAPVRFINYTVIPPRAGFGLHSHGRDNEFYVILEGCGVYEENGTKQEVKAGDVIMNAMFASHSLSNTGEKDMRVLVFEAAAD